MTPPDIQLNGSHPWEPFDIPGGTEPVSLFRLRYEEQTRAMVLLVRFPAGWKRTVTGFYETAEELLIIDGTLLMSGLTLTPGDWGYFPKRWLRTDMSAPTEVLAFARFSGPARWTPTDEQLNLPHQAARLADVTPDGTSPIGSGDASALHVGADGASYLITDLERVVNTGPGYELLDLETMEWSWIANGDASPSAARAFCRIP